MATRAAVRTYDACPVSKTAPANATTIVQWGPTEIDSTGVIAWHVVLRQTVATFDNTDISRVRQKSNGQTTMDCSFPELQAYTERFSPSHSSAALTDRSFTIPINVLDAATDQAADACQFMPGATATVEITFATDATGAGIAFIGWTKTTADPLFYMTLIAQPMNVNGAQTNQRVPLGAEGIVQGFGIVNGNLRELRLKLSGVQVLYTFGGSYNGLTNIGDMLTEIQSLYDAPDDATNVTSFTFLKLNQGLPANSATSEAIITSSSGMATSDELCLYTLVPLAVPETTEGE